MIDTDCDSEPSLIEVRQRDRGRWFVQDAARRIGGLFTTREAALRFAQAECDIHHGAFRLAPLASIAIEQ